MKSYEITTSLCTSPYVPHVLSFLIDYYIINRQRVQTSRFPTWIEVSLASQASFRFKLRYLRWGCDLWASDSKAFGWDDGCAFLDAKPRSKKVTVGFWKVWQHEQPTPSVSFMFTKCRKMLKLSKTSSVLEYSVLSCSSRGYIVLHQLRTSCLPLETLRAGLEYRSQRSFSPTQKWLKPLTRPNRCFFRLRRLCPCPLALGPAAPAKLQCYPRSAKRTTCKKKTSSLGLADFRNATH